MIIFISLIIVYYTASLCCFSFALPCFTFLYTRTSIYGGPTKFENFRAVSRSEILVWGTSQHHRILEIFLYKLQIGLYSTKLKDGFP